MGSKYGTVAGDYCALTGGQYRCGQGGVLCCNTGFKPKSNGKGFYCPGGPKKLSSDAPSVSCNLQPKKVCTGRREEYLDDTAGESGYMNPGRCQEICEKHEAEGCCMYEVDHLRCFIVKSGGALKTDNAVKRDYTSLGYHGVNYNEIPLRHAGFCKKKSAAEQSVGASCGEGCLDFIGEWMGDGSCDTVCLGCTEYYKNGVFDGGDCPATAEQSVGASCGEGCLDYIGIWMGDGSCDTACRGCSEYYKNGVFDGGDCPTTAAETSVGTFAAQQETSYVLNGFALLGLGALLYGAGAHYCKKPEAVHVDF